MSNFNFNLNNQSFTTSSSSCSATTGSKIFLSMGPLLLGFGTCTNIFSLLVLSRKRMRKHSTYSYLAILSVFDLLALWLGLLRDYLAHGYGIYMTSTWLCKLHSFMFYYVLDLSSWILVAVSVDRCLAISFIFTSSTRQLLLKVLSKPKIICSIICCSMFFLNLHFLFYVEGVNERNSGNRNLSSNLNHEKSLNYSQTKANLNLENKPQCQNSILIIESKSLIVMSNELSYENRLSSLNHKHSIGVAGEYFYCVIDEQKHPKYMNFFVNIWPYIDLSAYAILPFLIMFVSNIAIIKNAKFTAKNFISSSSLSNNPSKKTKNVTKNVSRDLVEVIEEEKSSFFNKINKKTRKMSETSIDNNNSFKSKDKLNNLNSKFNLKNKFLRFCLNNRLNRSSRLVLINSEKKRNLSVSSNPDHTESKILNNTRNSVPNITYFSSTSSQFSLARKTSGNLLYSRSQSLFSINPHARNLKMMSLTIIIVTCIFILLTLPIMLFIVFTKFSSRDFISENNLDSSSFAYSFYTMNPNCKSILWAIVNLFMYINHSINFVLYCLTGSKFRTELATLFTTPQSLFNNAVVLYDQQIQYGGNNNFLNKYNNKNRFSIFKAKNFNQNNLIPKSAQNVFVDTNRV